MTPLMVAAMFGHLDCVKLLLCHSADIHATIPPPKYRTQRQSAADLAAKSAHIRVSKYLQGCIGELEGESMEMEGGSIEMEARLWERRGCTFTFLPGIIH